jgi:hypothetical protein
LKQGLVEFVRTILTLRELELRVDREEGSSEDTAEEEMSVILESRGGKLKVEKCEFHYLSCSF